METKIKRTLTEWCPEIFSSFQVIEEASYYAVLNYFAKCTIELLRQKKIEQFKEHLKIINLLYTGGKLHEKNAIENEFLAKLVCDEIPLQLKTFIEMMPKELRAAYLKTILEN